jgi:uncharacterized membrane protein
MMVGVFLAFGVDTIIIVGVLWYIGQIPGQTAVGLSAAVLAVFALWVVGRWGRLRWADRPENGDGERADGRSRRDPLERLKQRYAEGDVSNTEFERQLDALLDADRRAESSEDRAVVEPAAEERE